MDVIVPFGNETKDPDNSRKTATFVNFFKWIKQTGIEPETLCINRRSPKCRVVISWMMMISEAHGWDEKN